MDERFYGLDFARCFAMLMGLVIHAPIVFMIEDVTGNKFTRFDSDLVSFIVGWIHLWRMPLFFLLSGFFAQLVLQKKGVFCFLKDRFVRIFLALIFFSSITNVIYGQDFGEIGHLWFLYYLILISLTAIPIYALAQACNISHLFAKYFKRILVKLSFCLIVFFLLILLTSVARINSFEAIIPESFSDIKIFSLVYYFIWFILGQIILKNSDILDFISTTTKVLFLSITSVLLVVCFMALFSYSHENQIISGYFWQLNFLSTLTSIAWVSFVLGLSHKLIKAPSKTLSFFLELSYPTYILHMIPSVCFGIAMYHAGFNDMQMMIPNIMLSGLSSLILYFIFIKYTPLNWFVNGYKHSWFQFRRLPTTKA